MLGMEARRISAYKLRLGDALAAQRLAGHDIRQAKVTSIAPTADPWVPDGLDVTLHTGDVLTLTPHETVVVICDDREAR